MLILHGTTGTGAGLLAPAFDGELFGPDQPLDARRYYVVLPDAIGHGKSGKPSDGLRTRVPKYNYDAQRISPLSIPAILRHRSRALPRPGPLSGWIELGTLVGQAAMFKPSATDVTEFAGRFYTPPCNVSV